jgi:hypothetical protein
MIASCLGSWTFTGFDGIYIPSPSTPVVRTCEKARSKNSVHMIRDIFLIFPSPMIVNGTGVY